MSDNDKTTRNEVEAAWAARTAAVLEHGPDSVQARAADAEFNAKAEVVLAAEAGK
jgi:hypothetical protein